MSQHAAYCHWKSWQSLGSLNYKKDQKYKYLEAVIQRCSVKKVLSEISENSQENTCARASFLVKLQAWGLRPATLLKKRLLHRCFPVNFVKFLITPFLYRTPLVAASEYQKVMYCFWFFSLFNLGMNEKNRENIYQNHIRQDQLSGIHGQCNQYPYKGHFVTCHLLSITGVKQCWALCRSNPAEVLCNFIEITLQHGCSLVNLLHIFRKPFLKNTSGGLLLTVGFTKSTREYRNSETVDH